MPIPSLSFFPGEDVYPDLLTSRTRVDGLGQEMIDRANHRARGGH